MSVPARKLNGPRNFSPIAYCRPVPEQLRITTMSMNIAVNGGMVKVPHPAPVRDQKVFHYTNAQGLIGIVEHHTLWATSTLALNDLSEVQYGIDLVREALTSRTGAASSTLQEMIDREDFAGVAGESYVFSGSTDGDSLTQWVAYAGSVGYAIEFDTHGDIERVDRMQLPESYVASLTVALAMGREWWYSVTYDRPKQIETVRAVLDVFDQYGFSDPSYLYLPIGLCITTFKDAVFANEREVRFISGRSVNGRENFRAGRYGVVPYAEVVSASAEDKRLPIRSVVIGPLNHDERPAAAATVRALLNANGYEHVDVRFSSAPYRF